MKHFDTNDLGKPLPGKEDAFEAALRAMHNAEATSMHRNGNAYWWVDRNASSLIDAVAIVDLRAIGNIAKGAIDWDEASQSCTIQATTDRHATRDVLETLIGLHERGMQLGLSESPKP